MGRPLHRLLTVLLTAALCVSTAAAAAEPEKPAAAAAKAGKLPHLEFDAKTKQIRVEAETLGVDTPLEFFAVVINGPEHEAVVRSKVKPSDLHTALLAMGLKPGSPVSWSKSLNKWLPPHGPPLQIRMEYEKDGKPVTEPANRWMRSVKTKEVMPATTWIFAGSRVMNDGNYAADTTGYLVSVVNFDMTVIDIPNLASASNESLEWERNPDTVPAAGTKVTMVIEPAGKPAEGAEKPAEEKPQADDAKAAAGAAAAAGVRGADGDDDDVSTAALDEALVERATRKWETAVGPKAKALREAAQAHYDTINALRREQQRLIDEADRVQRAIDRLERQYQDMTTPQPDFGGDAGGDAHDHAPAEAAPAPTGNP
jgi:hypothetical protein